MRHPYARWRRVEGVSSPREPRSWLRNNLSGKSRCSKDAERRTVINRRIVGEDGIEQLPVEAVDSCRVAGMEIIHADPIRHGEVTHILQTLLRPSSMKNRT